LSYVPDSACYLSITYNGIYSDSAGITLTTITGVHYDSQGLWVNLSEYVLTTPVTFYVYGKMQNGKTRSWKFILKECWYTKVQRIDSSTKVIWIGKLSNN
jgi:hypothetical protein